MDNRRAVLLKLGHRQVVKRRWKRNEINAASAEPKRRQSTLKPWQGARLWRYLCIRYFLRSSGDEAETRGSHGAGLARHGLGKALTLESRGQVHFAACEEAGKKLHDHLQSVAQTGRLRLMEWGSSFAGADIGSCKQKLNRKSEALDMKNDTECDKFGQGVGGVLNIYE
ncbi:hypothetical protein [Mesorhizobium sp. B3-2-1]|uniref:hypothetical protein n=1 Tax=Mesorhizobium sp. B3-2-1 TaxID=2589891 RepID=UPI0015E3E8F1|nr:hypothetical protein [Mesorhizobium sp. B3-2-1]